jgi:microcystin-dependent protein
MPGLPITITNVGRAALINAQNTGTNALTISQVALTSANMEGANFAAMTALPTELKRLSTFAGDVVADDTLHLTIRDESIQSYSMRGFGLILSDGTLFAVYGQAAPIVQKSSASIMLLAVDVVLASLTTAMIEFGDTDFINPPATVDRPGVIEIADQAEVDAGIRGDVAVPPSRLKVLLTALLGGKADSAHSHDAGHVTTGIFNVLRIPDLAMAKITGLATALAEKASLAGATFTGAFAISRASGPSLDLIGNAGTGREINFRTGANTRWRIRANGSAESGANNGSLLEFMRFADDGTYLGIPFAIIRATGQVSFETVPRVGTQQLWFEGNFDPNSKAAAIHSHDWAQVTGKPVLLQFVSALAASGSDLNLCVTPGFYRQPLDAGATDGANYPVGGAGIIEVLAQGNAVEQRYTRPSSGDVFHRGSIGGAWSAWRKFWDSGNFDPASKANAAHSHAGEDITSGTVPLARLPNIPASQTNSGVFDPARIPALAMSAITGLVDALAGKSNTGHVHSGADITSGTVPLARLPNIPASQTNSGVFDAARIPALAMSAITGLVDALAGKSNTGHVHSGADITSGTVPLARLPNLPATQTNSGTFDAARIPALDASKVSTGAFDPARIPSLDASKVTSGAFDPARIPNLTTSKITDLLDLVWPAGKLHLFDMAAVPAGNRCLVANGAVVSRTTYARLFAAIGTRYGAGDGATTFQIPDWRGVFFRGLDNGRGLDPGRGLSTGTYQASQNLQHRHSVPTRSSNGTDEGYVEDTDSGGLVRTVFTAYEGGSEARPINEALLACISY